MILVVWVLFLAVPAAGQARLPGIATGPAGLTASPYTDTLRALVVFVRFRDDDVPGEPAVDARGWPLFDNPATLPPFAHHLLAASPTPPFRDSTLTAYFFQQSQGRFLLYGDVYGSVVVSRHPEATYHAPHGGYGHLTAEVLDHLDAQGFDF
jgi:hypothetical protein